MFKNPVTTVSGEMIAKLKKHHNWSHVDVARRIGVNVQYQGNQTTAPRISKIAYGLQKLKPEEAERLEEIYEESFGERRLVPDDEISEPEERDVDGFYRSEIEPYEEQIDRLHAQVQDLKVENRRLKELVGEFEEGSHPLFRLKQRINEARKELDKKLKEREERMKNGGGPDDEEDSAA